LFTLNKDGEVDEKKPSKQKETYFEHLIRRIENIVKADCCHSISIYKKILSHTHEKTTQCNQWHESNGRREVVMSDSSDSIIIIMIDHFL